MAAVIEVEELRKRYGGLTAVDGASRSGPSSRRPPCPTGSRSGRPWTCTPPSTTGRWPGRSCWGLAERRGAAVGTLSGGQRQRLLIALALVGRPEVVFLDELTTGLDPQARRDTWELVRAVRDAGATVVLVTHLMEEAERLCDRVAVIDRGRLVALAPTPRVAEAAGLVGFFPMIFLSGAVVPRESLSEGMRRIGEVLPLTPVVDGLRAAWDGSGPGLLTLAALAAILMVATAVAARTFRWERPRWRQPVTPTGPRTSGTRPGGPGCGTGCST
jgi:energy-coupling factor transporter ATP-binding protein EcfA2